MGIISKNYFRDASSCVAFRLLGNSKWNTIFGTVSVIVAFMTYKKWRLILVGNFILSYVFIYKPTVVAVTEIKPFKTQQNKILGILTLSSPCFFFIEARI